MDIAVAISLASVALKAVAELGDNFNPKVGAKGPSESFNNLARVIAAADFAVNAANTISRFTGNRLGTGRDDPNGTLLRLNASPDEAFYLRSIAPEASDDDNYLVRLPKPVVVRVGGKLVVQVAYVQAIIFDVDSATDHTITAFVQKTPGDNSTGGAGVTTYTRNILARIKQHISATGWAYNGITRVDVGRIVPFNFISVRAASGSGDEFVGQVIYDIVRIPVFEFWNIIFTQFEIDVDGYFPLYAQLAQSTAWDIAIVQPS